MLTAPGIAAASLSCSQYEPTNTYFYSPDPQDYECMFRDNSDRSCYGILQSNLNIVMFEKKAIESVALIMQLQLKRSIEVTCQ